VQNLPDQTTEPVGDGTDGLRVSKARDEPAVHDRKDRPSPSPRTRKMIRELRTLGYRVELFEAQSSNPA
jgi:hypothetical protein